MEREEIKLVIDLLISAPFNLIKLDRRPVGVLNFPQMLSLIIAFEYVFGAAWSALLQINVSAESARNLCSQ